MKDKQKKKGIKKKILIFSTLLVLSSFGIVSAYVYNSVNKYENLIYPGVKIGTLYLEGKTKDEALQSVKNKYQEAILKKNVVIRTPVKDYSIEYRTLNARYNIEEVVNLAYDYGKDKSIIEKFKTIKDPLTKEYGLEFYYDSKPIDSILDTIEKEINKEAINASIIKEKTGSFNITPEQIGQVLDKEKLKSDIKAQINGDVNDEIDVIAKVDSIQPRIKKSDLEKINGIVSSYITDFTTSSENRATNIKLSTKAIDGVLLMPGDTFSFNDVVGKRTVEKGYKDAPVIINNKLVPGIGGGICQVSTTLYNAVLRANIPFLERVNHTLPSSYVGLGMDATVDYGNIDYKFKNVLSYPVYIEAYDENKKVIFNLYSYNENKNKSYDIVNDIYKTIQPKVEYIDDKNLTEGQEVVEHNGMPGYKVKVYKVAFENNKEVSKELLYEDYYAPITKRIRRGIKHDKSIANNNI